MKYILKVEELNTVQIMDAEPIVSILLSMYGMRISLEVAHEAWSRYSASCEAGWLLTVNYSAEEIHEGILPYVVEVEEEF